MDPAMASRALRGSASRAKQMIARQETQKSATLHVTIRRVGSEIDLAQDGRPQKDLLPLSSSHPPFIYPRALHLQQG